jgi:hypothetical protein
MKCGEDRRKPKIMKHYAFHPKEEDVAKIKAKYQE